jgi:hypothetical protein
MPPLGKIAEHWANNCDELFPENRCYEIGLGEPYCFRCGWLVPVDDAAGHFCFHGEDASPRDVLNGPCWSSAIHDAPDEIAAIEAEQVEVDRARFESLPGRPPSEARWIEARLAEVDRARRLTLVEGHEVRPLNDLFEPHSGFGTPTWEMCYEDCARTKRIEDLKRGMEGPTIAQTWAAASGYLDRSHLIDRCFDGLDHAGNLVPLCASCHKAMPSFRPGDEGAAVFWLRTGYPHEHRALSHSAKVLDGALARFGAGLTPEAPTWWDTDDTPWCELGAARLLAALRTMIDGIEIHALAGWPERADDPGPSGRALRARLAARVAA